MPTSNSEYQRLLFRHATDLEGYEEEFIAALVLLLRDTEEDLVLQIRRLLESLEFGGSRVTPARLERLERMLVKIRELRTRAWADYNKALRQELFDFAKDEVEFARTAFKIAIQLEGIELAAPSAATLRSALFERPFRLNANDARTLAEYMAGLRARDAQQIEQAIRIGFIEGQTLDQVIQRIRGTADSGYTNGILHATRRDAATIARTGLNHFANAARATLWEGNDDIILGLVWVSVLDGRTTLICQARDGHVAPLGSNSIPANVKLPLLIPPNARPPAHARCRSIMVVLISPEGLIGYRPYVIDSVTGRRTTFRSQAHRRRWAQRRVGRVPARTNYQQFISNEDFSFLVDVYGPTRAKLLVDGGLSIEDLVSRQGRRYTLEQLRQRNAEAFRLAGLNR